MCFFIRVAFVALNVILSRLFGKGVLNPSSKHQSKLNFFVLFFKVVKKKTAATERSIQ